jgi:hypothetical protein
MVEGFLRKNGIGLIDLNTCKSVLIHRKDTLNLREFHLPEILEEAFVISVP